MTASTIPVLVTGDDFALPVDLTVNGAAYDAGGAQITARIVALDHTAALADSVDQSAGASGADWAAGRVVVELPAANTAGIASYGQALIELQVDKGGRKATWFVSVVVVQGHVA